MNIKTLGQSTKNTLSKINAGTLLIAILTFVIGWQLGHKDVQVKWNNFNSSISVQNQEPPKDVNIDFKLFWDTWDLLSRQYIDKKALDPNKMFYGAISGMVASVGDPYTYFLPPDQQKSSQEELNGSFEGVGIQLGFNKDKRLIVIAPLAGSPAEKAGIKAQDQILEINEKDTSGMSLTDAVKLIRGAGGTQVNLTIFREGEQDTRPYTLTRGTIIVKSAESTVKETKNGKRVGVIKLSKFGDRTQEEWAEAVNNVKQENVDGILLDLRNNPGGYLEGAVFIASEFLPNGDVVLQENAKGERFAYKVNRGGVLLDIPLVVLINGGSASASEIVAGAIQDRNRGKVTGEKSFGKGTIQEAQELPGGTGLHVTVAKWLTPNGRWVNDTQGLEPDSVIELTDEEKENTNVDTQLEKALENF